MKTNNGFNIVKHKGGKATPKNGLATRNQATTGSKIIKHPPTTHSMYAILSDDEDGDDKVVGKDEAFVHSIVDGNIGNEYIQTNKATNRTSQTGEKLRREGQKSTTNNNTNKENDAVLNLHGGNDNDTSAKSGNDKCKKKKSKKSKKSKKPKNDSPTSNNSTVIPESNSQEHTRVQQEEDFQPGRVLRKAKD